MEENEVCPCSTLPRYTVFIPESNDYNISCTHVFLKACEQVLLFTHTHTRLLGCAIVFGLKAHLPMQDPDGMCFHIHTKNKMLWLKVTIIINAFSHFRLVVLPKHKE